VIKQITNESSKKKTSKLQTKAARRPTVLMANEVPELGANLVSALPDLDMDNSRMMFVSLVYMG